MELSDWRATDLVAAYRSGTLSPVDVLHSVLARAQQREPQLHALYLLHADAALQQARDSEQRWQRGAPLGPLDGVPVTLKENIATAGDPTPLGTAATALTPATSDAPPAARLRESGAVLWAKTTMPDYGMLSSGVSSLHTTARNPWDLSKTPGGSSAGAGAACAAGYGPLHVGTDIGGSLRLPASWCGIFSLKPSLGRIPIDPPYIGRVAGPMTRSVADAALLMQVLSQPDARDSMSLPPQDIAWHRFDGGTPVLRGLHIGLQLDAGCGLAVEDDVLHAVQGAAQRLAGAGAHVTPMAPFLSRAMLDGMDHAWRMRSFVDLQALSPERRERVLPYIRAWAESAQGMSGVQTFAAFSQFHATRVAAVAASAPFDYVVSPTAPITAFSADWASPTNDPLRPLEHIAFTVPWNMSEQPSASIPCGVDRHGLPIGLQITGRRFDDLGVLRVCRAFELLTQRATSSA